MDDATIAESIRRARESADLSQSDVARALGVDYRTVQRYEHAERSLPARLLAPWALACGLAPAALAATIWGQKKSPAASPQPSSE